MMEIYCNGGGEKLMLPYGHLIPIYGEEESVICSGWFILVWKLETFPILLPNHFAFEDFTIPWSNTVNTDTPDKMLGVGVETSGDYGVLSTML